MVKTKIDLKYITIASLIAALYAALTFFGNIFGLSYGPIQVRFSEVLTILPLFTPAAIPGLTVGCFIANIASFNPLDMIFGTFATLLAALLTYYLKDIKIKKLPLLAFFPPVITNAFIIGAEIAFFYLEKGFSIYGFLISAIQIGIGQIIACIILGIPFYYILKKTNLSKAIGQEKK